MEPLKDRSYQDVYNVSHAHYKELNDGIFSCTILENGEQFTIPQNENTKALGINPGDIIKTFVFLDGEIRLFKLEPPTAAGEDNES